MKADNDIARNASTRTTLFSGFGIFTIPLLISLSIVTVRADIVQTQHNGYLSLGGGGVGRGLGQTFTADASVTNLQTIEWWYESVNPSYPHASVTVSLYQGDPLTGSLLRQVPLSLGDSMPSEWVSVDFSGVTLSSGGTYSFTVLSASAQMMEGGVGYAGSLYPGGIRYQFLGGGSSPTTMPTTDMSFQIIGVVPEPSTIALAALGGVALLAYWIRTRCKRGDRDAA